MADKLQLGLASQYPEDQSGGALILGGGRRRRRKSNLSGVNAHQLKELKKLIRSYHGGQTRRGIRRSRRRGGVNQKGGFIGWLAKQIFGI